MNPATITALVGQIEALRGAIGEHDADEVLRADMIEGETEADAVLSRLARTVKFAKGMASATREAKRVAVADYDRRADSFDRIEETARVMALTILEAEGVKSRKLPDGTLSVIDGRASLQLSPDFTPPQGFQRVKIDPDKKAISEALAAGGVIPGAWLETGPKTVMVR